MFEIFLTEEAGKQLLRLKTDKGLMKRHKAVIKTLQFLAGNPRHPGLQTHEFTSLKGPLGEKVLKLTRNNQLRLRTVFSGFMAPEKTGLPSLQ